MAQRRFRPTLWGTLAATAGVAATIALGFWQTDRAQQKLALAATQARLADEAPIVLGEQALDPDRSEHRRVEARGRFDPRGMVLLDNRVRKGIAGFEVVMPLALAGGRMYVLVNRGWVAGRRERRELPEVRTPAGDVTVIGRATVPGRRLYELSEQTTEGKVWQNLTVDRYRERMRYPVHGIVIEQSNDLDDALVRNWPAPDRGVNTHRSYAFQWFALAALIAVVYIVLSLRRDPSHP